MARAGRYVAPPAAPPRVARARLASTPSAPRKISPARAALLREYIGRKVRKEFEDPELEGVKQMYGGEVIGRSPGARATIARSVGALGKNRAPLRYEEKSKWFMVLYDDGDKEDMTLAELNKHLLPEHTTLRARYDEDQASPPGSPFSDRTMTDAEALMQLRDTVPEPRSARADPPSELSNDHPASRPRTYSEQTDEPAEKFIGSHEALFSLGIIIDGNSNVGYVVSCLPREGERF